MPDMLAMERAVLDRCLDLTTAGRPDATEDETRVPVAHYTDPARFAAERTKLFRERPIVVAHQSELPRPGDFITRDLVGQPVLVVRGDDGIARAFLNVCRHRGATLTEEPSGHCKRFVCPYHAWSYTTDGQLAAVRHREAGFPQLDMAATRLGELVCLERGGLLWVVPDPAITTWPASTTDTTLYDELAHFGVPDGVVFAKSTKLWRGNWKLFVDGGLEAYHFRVAHRDTVGPYFADNIVAYEELGDHIRFVLPRSDFEKAAAAPHAPGLRELTHVLYGLFPNATVLLQAGHFDLIQMDPVSIDQTRITITTVVPDPGETGHSDKAQRFWQKNHDFTVKTLEEDFTIGERIQRGVHSGANTHFRFARFEGALTSWHRRVNALLDA